MKTKEEKLRAVTEDIRAKLPRLKELEKGCKLMESYTTSMYPQELEILHRDKNTVWVQDCHSLTISGISRNELSFYIIIGKEPTILDCLEYLNSFHNPIKDATIYELLGNGNILKINDDYALNDNCFCCSVDLSKPLLKDNDELINFLYELL